MKNADFMVVVEQQKGLKYWLGFFLPRIFLLLAVLLAFASSASAEMKTFSIIFLSILFEAMPFMLLGSLAGGFIEEFVSRDKVTAWLPAGSHKSVFLAAAVGFIMPVCECAIVPVVKRLLRKGVPFSAAIAYLMAGPIVNPIVALSTAVAYFYDWKVVFARLALGYIAAVIIGLLVNYLVKEGDRLAPIQGKAESSFLSAVPIASLEGSSVLKKVSPVAVGEELENGCCSHVAVGHGCNADSMNFWSRLIRAVRHGANDFLEVACFLVVGAFFATAAQTFVDRQAIIGLMSQSWLAIVVMMLLAIILNLCSEADAFIASSFRQLVGMPGQMAFMVIGPMFDIKLFFMYFSVFSRKTAITLGLVTFLVVFLLTLLASPLLSGGAL